MDNVNGFSNLVEKSFSKGVDCTNVTSGTFRSTASSMQKAKSNQCAASLEALPRRRQAALLAEALLREYMHKRHFTSTLETFDNEHARTAETVSSRALMREMMVVSPQMATEGQEAGLDTIMEILCFHRIRKRINAPNVQRLREEYAEIENTRKDKKKKKKNHSHKSRNEEEDNSGIDVKMDLTWDDLLNEGASTSLSGFETAVKEGGSGKSLTKKANHHSGSDTTHSKPHTVKFSNDFEVIEKKDCNSMQEREITKNTKSDLSLGKDKKTGSSPSEIIVDGAASLRGGNKEKRYSPTSFSGSETSPEVANASSFEAILNGNNKSDDAFLFAERLGSERAGSVLNVLVGKGSSPLPDAFLYQGFFFSCACEELRFGLVQNQSGCCGVIAAVQALLLLHFIQNCFIFTREVQEVFLCRTLADVLVRCQPDISQILIVTPCISTKQRGMRRRMTREQQHFLLAEEFSTVKTPFRTRDDVCDALSKLLCSDPAGDPETTPRPWGEAFGHGLLAFLASVILSRGEARIARDMDIESPLIADYGNCTQELINLLISGCATSNTHDGVVVEAGMQMTGLEVPPGAKRLDVGFLTTLEARGTVRVGKLGKYPKYPIWITSNEGRYAVIFMKEDSRESVDEKGKVQPFDMFFYDQLAGQKEEVRIRVIPSDDPLPPEQEGERQPYQNILIRTVDEWRLARISWMETQSVPL